eukprot:CAMPEP_0167760780 /NCGR_PEP_ID=MMETSP0110_2-20121227/11779_1 /TAXON_ID=629695 /ORGANISM="Gymnochlora sp., Strain CCMP2014" /LENGTH=570 /DNA_ID=CAMNT_0007647335 /DNA_START=670 /DNA_END=2382 /DNA_ORIENTATION=-
MANESKSKLGSHSRTLSVWWENQDDVASLATLTSDNKSHSDLKSNGSEFASNPISNEEKENESIGTQSESRSRAATGWENRKGYKSLEVKVNSGDFTELDVENINCFLAVSLGLVERVTGTVKSEKPKWKTSFKFPITMGLSFVNIVAMSKGATEDELLGTLQIPLAKIEATSGTRTIQMWNADETEQVDCKISIQCILSKQELKAEDSKGDGSGRGLNYIRTLVSKKKNRYVQDGFDLDLSYVGDNLIAMGFPSEGIEASFRNPMNEVQKFLKFKHEGHFAVYNLCSERAYPPDKFPIVKRFPFDDHNPCPFDVLVDFCKDVKFYLDKNPKNVAAIHCKAGKGRTGLTISAYLIYSGFKKTAQEALTFFASKRTRDGKGVTIQSQRRYVHYFEKYVSLRRKGLRPPDKTLMLYEIQLKGVNKSSDDIWFQILNKGQRFKSENTLIQRKGFKEGHKKWIEFSLQRSPIPLYKDVKIIFYRRNEKIFHFWFNTQFVTGLDLVIPKANIDKASRDKKHKKYPADLCVELHFQSRTSTPRESKLKRFDLKTAGTLGSAARGRRSPKSKSATTL